MEIQYVRILSRLTLDQQYVHEQTTIRIIGQKTLQREESPISWVFCHFYGSLVNAIALPAFVKKVMLGIVQGLQAAL